MFKKGSKVYGIIKGVCPKCHNESMYKNPNPYAVTQLFEMHERCSHCNTKYKIEPSFFYGSMYVSYGVGIAFAVAAFVISYLFLNSTLTTAFIVIVATMIVLYPIIIRLSRNIWINLFMSYDKNLDKTNKA
ncbi:DUF983 domain-containing protein [Aurantibacter aestuarii]|uniref:DUF983 domain-containing protein n=1 Tax=Aurantibacter aestuarii TaxID=1266046 RepID=A0A2T1NEL3_9FLAO|nr:DUF983 domain-containing protein [Aurantibacter aestuarii]PSG90860.1 DUF983 domain-containing protein [Aurantibacter aestuarii]